MRTMLTLAIVLLAATFTSCEKSNDVATSSDVPSAGWRLGTTNYSTTFAIRNAGQPNSIGFFSALPNTNGFSGVAVIFNNTTGIAAGTYKVVVKTSQSLLLADEIMVSTGTNYSQSTGRYEKDYVTALTETVNATVTISGGKARIVVPTINMVSLPITTSSVTAPFAGTLIEP
jgi:hypothetical protein